MHYFAIFTMSGSNFGRPGTNQVTCLFNSLAGKQSIVCVWPLKEGENAEIHLLFLQKQIRMDLVPSVYSIERKVQRQYWVWWMLCLVPGNFLNL